MKSANKTVRVSCFFSKKFPLQTLQKCFTLKVLLKKTFLFFIGVTQVFFNAHCVQLFKHPFFSRKLCENFFSREKTWYPAYTTSTTAFFASTHKKFTRNESKISFCQNCSHLNIFGGVTSFVSNQLCKDLYFYRIYTKSAMNALFTHPSQFATYYLHFRNIELIVLTSFNPTIHQHLCFLTYLNQLFR